MAGDLNCTPKHFQDELKILEIDHIELDRTMMAARVGNMYTVSDCEVTRYEHLPPITGADNKHPVGCFDVSIARPPEFPPSRPPSAPGRRSGRTGAYNEVLEQQGRNAVWADMQTAKKAERQCQEAEAEEPQRQERDADTQSAREAAPAATLGQVEVKEDPVSPSKSVDYAEEEEDPETASEEESPEKLRSPSR